MDEGKLVPMWYEGKQIPEDLYFLDIGEESDGNVSCVAEAEVDDNENECEDDEDAINVGENEYFLGTRCLTSSVICHQFQFISIYWK